MAGFTLKLATIFSKYSVCLQNTKIYNTVTSLIASFVAIAVAVIFASAMIIMLAITVATIATLVVFLARLVTAFEAATTAMLASAITLATERIFTFMTEVKYWCTYYSYTTVHNVSPYALAVQYWHTPTTKGITAYTRAVK